MIAYLSGKIKYIADDYIILNVNNVGYRIHLTPVAFSKVPEAGEDAEFFIHTYVREDAINLYGFRTFEELDFFKTIIAVAGIGPKAGLGVLSAAGVEEIKKAIAEEDTSLFTRVPGVGKKTAERIILELKSKVDVVAGKKKRRMGGEDYEDAIAALVKLGVSTREAEQALAEVPKEVASQGSGEQVRWVLKNIG